MGEFIITLEQWDLNLLTINFCPREKYMLTINDKHELKIRRLHPLIGAEVTNVDFQEPLKASIVEKINQAWMDYQILVFPNQKISDEQHVAVTRNFGKPEIFHQSIIKSKFIKEIFHVSNTDENGRLMPQSDPIQQQLSSAKKWHTDSSYRSIPAMGSLPHGVEVSRTGELPVLLICMKFMTRSQSVYAPV